MMDVPRALRFIFWGLFDCMWRMNALFMRTLPDPVMRKRFLAPDFVFIFDISSTH